MKEYLSLLKTVDLFQNILDHELEILLHCLKAKVIKAQKDDIVLLAGSTPTAVGIVLTGKLHIYKEDSNGNRFLLNTVTSGQLFAETLCCAAVTESPVTVIAESDCDILLTKLSKLLTSCPSSCIYHTKLIENLLMLVAAKNLQLQERIEIITIKSLRSKVLYLLESFARKQGNSITLPFNRNEMAEFLVVDRSALSHELMKMKKEGLIDYHKNSFILKTVN